MLQTLRGFGGDHLGGAGTSRVTLWIAANGDPIYEAVPASLAAQGAEGLRRVLTGMHEITALPGTEPVMTADSSRPGTQSDRDLQPPTSGTTARREAELLAYTTRASDRLARSDPGAALMRALRKWESLLVERVGVSADVGRAITEAIAVNGGTCCESGSTDDCDED